MDTSIFLEGFLCPIAGLDIVYVLHNHFTHHCGPGYGLDGPGVESQWGTRFFAHPDRSWGPISLLYNGYRDFLGGKVRPERAADHSPPSSATVMEE